jgi:hypothetical protein
MKVKILATGDVYGTQVMSDSGNPVEGIRAINFQHVAGGVPEIEIEILLVPLVAEGTARMIGPNGKEIHKIIYVDGTEDLYPQEGIGDQ